MFLFQTPEFPKFIQQVASEQKISEEIVEKDYYVTEALRAIVSDFGSKILFKGGTSLSKAWGLVHRFSEDVDLYVNPEDRGTKATNTLLKNVIQSAQQFPGFRDPVTINRIDGVARSCRLHYNSQVGGSDLPKSILIELGIQSGTFPKEEKEIQSFLGQRIQSAAPATLSPDCEPFSVWVLHFKRTLVEKLFALHDKVERGYLQEGQPLKSYARHYYDIAKLLSTQEAVDMLNSGEYAQIVTDYHRITRKYFKKQLFPAGNELATSKALFPDSQLSGEIKEEYEGQCKVLCFPNETPPPWDEVLHQLSLIRDRLISVDAS